MWGGGGGGGGGMDWREGGCWGLLDEIDELSMRVCGFGLQPHR